MEVLGKESTLLAGPEALLPGEVTMLDLEQTYWFLQLVPDLLERSEEDRQVFASFDFGPPVTIIVAGWVICTAVPTLMNRRR